MRPLEHLVVAPLERDDAVGFARCIALDAELFPRSAIPLTSFVQDARIWLAKGQDAHGLVVAGFAASRSVRDVLEIVALGVDTRWRRLGIGRALVRAVVGDPVASKHTVVSLHVSASNRGAVRLYESEGFRRVRRLPRYYHPSYGFGEDGDAWLMMREPLTPARDGQT